MQPAQKVLGGRKKVRVAIVQTPPVFFDREKTIDRACQKIEVAARNGAELIVFTEAWIPGYPYWSEHWDSDLTRWASVRAQYYDNAVIIPSEDTDRLCAAAAATSRKMIFPPTFPWLIKQMWIGRGGGSSIISPLGVPLVPPTFGNTIIYADCEADMIEAWKAIIDTSGHYSRPDIVSLDYKGGS